MIARAGVACAAALCLARAAAAQDQIEPDRPDVTNGTHIVDIGLLQIEFGGVYARSAAGPRSFGSPLTARVGLTDWLELRGGTDGLVSQTDGVVRQTGIGNTNVGAKLRLWADPGGLPLLSILPTINFPTADAAEGFGTGDRDYLLALLTGTDIGRHWHVDGNYGIGRIGAGGGQPHFTQHLLSVSASAAATDNLNPYAETFWFSRQEPGGGGVAAVDAGAIYELGPRYAIDGGMQVDIVGDTQGIALFGGLSVVVGDILGKHGVNARQRQVQRRRARAASKRSTR